MIVIPLVFLQIYPGNSRLSMMPVKKKNEIYHTIPGWNK